MPHFAVRALGSVIEELTRADQIDLRVLDVIWSDIGGPHFANYQLSTDPRPEWVLPAVFPKIDNWSIDEEMWLGLGPENSIVPVTSSFNILAEHSEFAFLGDWKKRSTIRTSLPVTDWVSRPDENLFNLPKVMDLGHLSTVFKDHDKSMLCTIDDMRYGDLREPTLTLNSKLLKELGWKRSEVDPFEIYGVNGEIVAKTINWMDGVGYPENSSVERSGHGNVVLISDSSRAELEERFGKLLLRTRVIQRYESQEGTSQKIYFDGVAEED
ncbi:hypothetical protein A3197_17995 [Candidatus Thiodiazotropha endoloripes]|nr:hypothetical protein A3197_17995 [Candidatus Thiodiazotropha endoloripes]